MTGNVTIAQDDDGDIVVIDEGAPLIQIAFHSRFEGWEACKKLSVAATMLGAIGINVLLPLQQKVYDA